MNAWTSVLVAFMDNDRTTGRTSSVGLYGSSYLCSSALDQPFLQAHLNSLSAFAMVQSIVDLTRSGR